MTAWLAYHSPRPPRDPFSTAAPPSGPARSCYSLTRTLPRRAAMRVFVFDLLPYSEHLDHLVEEGELPWPLPRRHFKPEVAVRTYAEHLEAWEALDRLGYDGVGFNEHHTSPYGLMNSPNLIAAAPARRTQRLQLHM